MHEEGSMSVRGHLRTRRREEEDEKKKICLLLHVTVLERNEGLSTKLGQSSVDLLAEEVEDGVDDERSGLVEERAERREEKCQCWFARLGERIVGGKVCS